jgi:transcriptional regulator with XRE-family HTH domain
MTPTANQIRRARTAAGLTRLQLAGRITGATPEQLATARLLVSLENTIRYWESGDRIPSAVYARALADALQLDPDDAL